MNENTKGKKSGRDYGKILDVLKAAGRAMCAFEFDAIHSVGCTEATLARRLREAAALGLVVPSKRQAESGAYLTQYRLPVMAGESNAA